jgi:hypothetical protein
MTFDVDGPKPILQAVAEAEPAAGHKPALPAPTTAEPPKKPSGSGGRPTLRRIK